MAGVKTVRLRNTTSGAVVEVREDKVLGSEWVPAEKKQVASKAPAAKSGK